MPQKPGGFGESSILDRMKSNNSNDFLGFDFDLDNLGRGSSRRSNNNFEVKNKPSLSSNPSGKKINYETDSLLSFINPSKSSQGSAYDWTKSARNSSALGGFLGMGYDKGLGKTFQTHSLKNYNPATPAGLANQNAIFNRLNSSASRGGGWLGSIGDMFKDYFNPSSSPFVSKGIPNSVFKSAGYKFKNGGSVKSKTDNFRKYFD